MLRLRMYIKLFMPLLSFLAFIVSIYDITHDAPTYAIYWLLYSWMAYQQSNEK
jgi:hypothetical protein